MEIAVDGDAGVFEFDTGVFEAEVEIGLTTGGKNQTIDADHFFGAVGLEDDATSGAVFFDGNNAAIGQDHSVELFGEIIGDGIASFFVFVRKEAIASFHDNDFGAETSKVGSDFAAGGAAANDEGDFGESANFEGSIWREAFDGVGADDFGSFERRAGSDDKIAGGEFVFAEGDGVTIEKMDATFEISDTGFFESGPGMLGDIGSGAKLVIDYGRKAEVKVLVFEFGK